MKFKFCGDLDCPDWALAAISLLTKLTSVKMRQLAQEIAKAAVEGSKELENARKICYDGKLSLEETKMAISAAEFFLTSAVKYAVNAEAFSNELQQLGFPKEHAGSLSKVYQSSPQLADTLSKSTFRVSRLLDVKMRPNVMVSLTNSPDPGDMEPGVSVLMRVDGPDRIPHPYSFFMSLEKFLILKHEVSEILHVMDSLPAV